MVHHVVYFVEVVGVVPGCHDIEQVCDIGVTYLLEQLELA